MVSCYYSQAASPLGPVYLATTPQGLVYCSTPGGSRGAMLEWLHRQLPGVPCQSGSQPHLGQAQEQLQDYFSGQRRELNVPLQLIGTPFQQSVWQALRTIPYGQTCTYGEIARQIGRPRAARAVGQANNKNPVALFVP